MTAVSYKQPLQAHYGSPTIRPMHHQPISKPAPPAQQQQALPPAMLPPTPRRTSPMRRTPSPRLRRSMDAAPRKHIWVVTGPAGCGKTTIAMALAKELQLPYIEGDDWHTKEAVATMASGAKLTDQYRWDWLIVLREQCLRVLREAPSQQPPADDTSLSTYNNPQVWTPPSLAASPLPPDGVVLTCSALKRKYRDEFRVASHPVHAHSSHVIINFIYCDISEAESTRRVGGRVGHYMKAAAVHAQFETLERPTEDECALDSLVIDVMDTPERVRARVWSKVREVLEEEEAEWSEEAEATSR